MSWPMVAYMSTQISTSVQRTTEVVIREPLVETLSAVLVAPADQDTPEMDSTAQVMEVS